MSAEFTISVRTNGAVPVNVASVSVRPLGTDCIERSTVCGWTLTEVVDWRPPESVAVSWISRYEGYSWSGAGNDPLATPLNVWYVCVWQFEGQ